MGPIIDEVTEMTPELWDSLVERGREAYNKRWDNRVLEVWNQDGYEIREFLVDGTLNVIMKKIKSRKL